jgi:hypothetical protein
MINFTSVPTTIPGDDFTEMPPTKISFDKEGATHQVIIQQNVCSTKLMGSFFY